MSARYATSGSLSAQNTFTASTSFAWQVWFNLSISGTFAATITLQKSFDNGVSWIDHEAYTTRTEKVILNAEAGVQWRLGIKPGGYTSGTAVCRLSQ